MRCGDLLGLLKGSAPLPPCREAVSRVLPCAHTADVPCHSTHGPPPLCRRKVDERFTYPCGEHSVQGELCARLTQLKAEADPECPFPVTCPRHRCGHQVTVSCHLRGAVTAGSAGEHLLPMPGPGALDAGEGGGEAGGQAVVAAGVAYCSPCGVGGECVELVRFQSPCGHTRSHIPCARAFEWASGEVPLPRCEAAVELPSPLCGHTLRVPCWTCDELRAWAPWGDVGAPERATITVLDAQDQMWPQEVVREGDAMPRPRPLAVPLECLVCASVGAHYARACGHGQQQRCVGCGTVPLPHPPPSFPSLTPLPHPPPQVPGRDVPHLRPLQRGGGGAVSRARVRRRAKAPLP